MARKILIFFLLLSALDPVLADTYPKIDLSGYKKWEYRGAQVSPDSNYFSGLTQLGGFSPNASGNPWQERMHLKILSQLSDKLTVSYDIDQQPETPEQFNVKLNYDNKHELTFGDFTAAFSGNEFASTTRVLNGMMLTSRDEGYNLILVPSTKLKSGVRGLTRQKGNNSKGPYSLGNGSIIENSERIELNGKPLTRGKDYSIDYMEGKLTFPQIITEDDEFTFSYEYTNISDMFFPALSKKDFFGFQSRFKLDPNSWGKSLPKAKEVMSTAYEIFPTASAECPTEDIMGEEGAGIYRLKNYPVSPFSETIAFRGAVLIKDKDYLINYTTGKVKLLIGYICDPGDPLRIIYSYKRTERVQEILPGGASRGPYVLYNQNLVPNSEQVSISDRLLTPNYDYAIDYDNGRLIFNFDIPKTSAIKIDYKYVAMDKPPLPPTPKLKQELTVGMTYLRESMKSGAGAVTASYSENFAGADLISGNNAIYLSRYPLTPSSEGGALFLTLNGRLLTPEVDYAVPTSEADPATGYARVTPDTKLAFLNDRADLTDGYYTGTIKLLAPVQSTDTIGVSYTYNKTIIGRYTGVGTGGRGPYYIRNYRNIVPGTEKIDVWDTGSNNMTVYTRNSSFEMDAGYAGYSINYYKETPYVMFNKELAPNQNFSVSFQYVPPSSPGGNDVKQEITGFDAAYKLGDNFEFYGNMAASKTDNVTVSKTSVESVVFIPPTRQVKIFQHNTPAIIDATEKVYVNNYLRNRDIDYIIDYTTGTINFFYITLTTADAVVVEYEYPDPAGIVKVGETVDSALKYGAKATLGRLALNYNSKAIGFDFIPFGGTAIGVGSSYKDFSAALEPNLFGILNTAYTYRENNDPQANSRTAFNRSCERNYSVGANPFGWMPANFTLRNYETTGDPLTGSGSAGARAETNDYAGNIAPPGFALGPLSFGHRYDGRLTDSRDYTGGSFSRNKYFHSNFGVGLTHRVKGELDLAFSEPYSLSGYKTSQEALASKSSTRDLAYDLNFDLTHGGLQKWTAYAKFINHSTETILPVPGLAETRNTTYHTELAPTKMLFLSYDQNRQETPSVLVNGKNPMYEISVTSVKLAPFSNLTADWSHASDATIHDTGLSSSGKTDKYSTGWTIYSSEKVALASSMSKYLRSETAPSGSIEALHADTDAFAYGFGMALNPIPVLSISPSFGQEDFKYSAEGQAPQEARSQTTTVNITYTPFMGLKTTANYSLKTTSTPAISPRHKANLNLLIGYQVFEGGDIEITQDEETNQGEVLANGTVPELDYVRTTRALSLNFSIPQNYPVLSGIILTLSYKTVGYDNRLPGKDADDLHAAMVTFDGTLNF